MNYAMGRLLPARKWPAVATRTWLGANFCASRLTLVPQSCCYGRWLAGGVPAGAARP
jgi:hypothetical protein